MLEKHGNRERKALKTRCDTRSMPLVIRCPKCGQTQKFLPLKSEISEKTRKKCVYCNASIQVYKAIVGTSER